MRVFLCALVALLPAALVAQDPAATCECSPKAGTLVIRYTGNLDESNPAWPNELTAVKFFSLLVTDNAGTTVEDTTSKTIVCRLKNDTYEVTFEPGISNVNLLGMCGAEVTGVVTIKRNGKVILDQQEFENTRCMEREKMLTRITVEAGSSKPQLKFVPYRKD